MAAPGVVGRGGEGDHDLQAAVGAGAHAQVGVVGGGDRGDDRQAKAVAGVVAGPVGAAALEGPQQPAQLGGRDRRAAVEQRCA